MRDSFDLYSGLFVYNRFAKQEVWNYQPDYYFQKYISQNYLLVLGINNRLLY